MVADKKRRGKKKKKTCFVISAIGKPRSDTRKRADSVLKEIIQCALELPNVSYNVRRIDKQGGAGDITEGIIDMLRTADLVIADLTDRNPNVMCEMGIRQAWNLPLIPIVAVEQLNALPFDVKVVNTVPYFLKTKKSKMEAMVGIRKQVRSILRGEQKDTIFSQAISQVGKRFSMDSVYGSLKDALTDTDHAIFDFKHELGKTLDLGDKKTVDNFGAALRRVFDRLSDKLYVFEQVARGRPGEYTDMRMLLLVEHARKTLKVADKIDRLLMSKKPALSKKVKVDKLLDSTIQSIDRVAKIIANQ